MRCLFCKQDSSNTKSVEHIIPESLGNKTLILPRGYVCDKCNNYFAIKVEKPFMELPEIRQLRSQELIPNKKNKIPQMEALYNGKFPAKLGWNVKNDDIIGCIDITDEAINELIKRREGFFVFPAFTNETIIQNSSIVSRLLAKMAFESLANTLKSLPGSLDELVDSKEFDPIRNHARKGTTPVWPCSIRRIYNMNNFTKRENGEWEQVIHESDFLVLDKGGEGEMKYIILYFVVSLWGMEFAINMAGPEIDEYNNWVKEHDGLSPLHAEKNIE